MLNVERAAAGQPAVANPLPIQTVMVAFSTCPANCLQLPHPRLLLPAIVL